MTQEESQAGYPRRRRRLLWSLVLAVLFILLCVLLVAVVLRMLQPTADAGGPYEVDEAQELTFDGSGSAGWLLSDYAWDFGDGDTGSGVSPSHTYDDGPDQVTVQLTVANRLGRTASDTAQVTVNNLPPTADAGGPYLCEPGETITLSGTCDDPSPVDAASLTCTWADFSGAAISQPSYTCPDSPGQVTVTLTATDKDGASRQDAATIDVGGDGQGPNANPNGPYSEQLGNPVNFDGSASTPPEEIQEYLWDFGDGETGMGAVISHTYATTGTFDVTLTVTDADGRQDTGATTATITSEPNQPPTAVLEVSLIAKTAQCYRFDGSGSFDPDPDGTIEGYEWDFGDGNTDEDKESVEYCYEASGTYTATLTVIDNLGAPGSASEEIIIPDIDP